MSKKLLDFTFRNYFPHIWEQVSTQRRRGARVSTGPFLFMTLWSREP